MGFKDSEMVGRLSENDIIAFYREKGKNPVKIKGKFSGFDIFVPETKSCIEVKRDFKSQYTGNLVVEIEMFGKPSGLMVTTADWWVFDTGEHWIWIKPERIKDCIIEGEYKAKEFIGEGDKDPKTAFIVPEDAIKKYAERILKRYEPTPENLPKLEVE